MNRQEQAQPGDSLRLLLEKMVSELDAAIGLAKTAGLDSLVQRLLDARLEAENKLKRVSAH
jgi:hypothetical protein